MTRLPELPADLAARIEKHLEDELPQGYDVQLEEAWAMLPQPPTRWNYWPQSLAKDGCEYAVETSDWELAERWLERGRQAYAATGDAEEWGDAPMDHWEARIKVARGDADARAYCERLLAQYGPRFFSGELDADVRALLGSADR